MTTDETKELTLVSDLLRLLIAWPLDSLHPGWSHKSVGELVAREMEQEGLAVR